MRGTSSSRGINTRNLFTRKKKIWTKINGNAYKEGKKESPLVNTLNPRFSFVKMRGTFFRVSRTCLVVHCIDWRKSLAFEAGFFTSFFSFLFPLSPFSLPSRAHFFPLIWDLKNVNTITQWNSITQMKYLIATLIFLVRCARSPCAHFLTYLFSIF